MDRFDLCSFYIWMLLHGRGVGRGGRSLVPITISIICSFKAPPPPHPWKYCWAEPFGPVTALIPSTTLFLHFVLSSFRCSSWCCGVCPCLWCKLLALPINCDSATGSIQRGINMCCIHCPDMWTWMMETSQLVIKFLLYCMIFLAFFGFVLFFKINTATSAMFLSHVCIHKHACACVSAEWISLFYTNITAVSSQWWLFFRRKLNVHQDVSTKVCAVLNKSFNFAVNCTQFQRNAMLSLTSYWSTKWIYFILLNFCRVMTFLSGLHYKCKWRRDHEDMAACRLAQSRLVWLFSHKVILKLSML